MIAWCFHRTNLLLKHNKFIQPTGNMEMSNGLDPKRGMDETYEDYCKHREKLDKAVKSYLAGKYVWWTFVKEKELTKEAG